MVPYIDGSEDGHALGVPPLSPLGRPQIGAAILMGPVVATVVVAGVALQIAVHNLHLLRKLDRASKTVDVVVVLTPVAY